MTSECTLIATKSRLTARCTREVGGCECGARGDELGGCALEDDASAVVPGAGPEIDEVIGVGHDRLMVFDDDDRAARIDEVVEQPEQIRDVGEVKTRRRFVEDDDRGGVRSLRRQVGGELESLPFTTRERCQRLAQTEIAETDIDEGAGDARRSRHLRLPR